MKSMSLGSPMVIVVVGVPGVGKSFFARRFAETFSAPLVSEDKIRYTLFTNHTYSKNENVMVEQVARLIVDELLVNGKTFILDGGYSSRVSRDNIAHLASQYDFRTLIVWVQTEEATARRRAQNRSLKVAGDQYKQSLTPEQWDTLAKAFTAPDIENKERNTVVISGKHTYAAQAKTVLRKIVESRADLMRTDTPINREDSIGRSIFPSI
ncbi:MAG: ATP-binding protein [Candidatus Nomurabacteria bacterium]|nr:ATP-binding protein [Candidatus Nomurabacteria bacterium]